DNPILLPNAPRRYRNGTHRGIDFYANWGSSVRSVADGVVIRADHNFKEVSHEFRSELLRITTQVGRTPSDIFEHILVGQSVYIDHGFDLIPGYRCISIYAHLSHIDGNISPGTKVTQGQELGMSGNSGTKPSTLGTRGGSHLHWELILQDDSGEYFLGQGLDVNANNILTNIFY
ncbi:MAG: M23 family metallopeptidase, partial [Candidatus Marinimicrobia bacterium]|nr:M23 family metallopeptidase [Candidatus Neomarinimicrobiota bacterium]